MIRTLAKCALVAALAISAGGCAATASDDGDSEMVRQAHETLSTNPKGLLPIYTRATWDPNLERTMLDISTSQIPPIDQVPDHDPHNGDQFLAVLVYVDRDGRRDLLQVYAGNRIGPGGGCIHVEIPASIGDRIFVGGVVKLDGTNRAQIAAAPVATVVSGDWQNDPTVELHPH